MVVALASQQLEDQTTVLDVQPVHSANRVADLLVVEQPMHRREDVLQPTPSRSVHRLRADAVQLWRVRPAAPLEHVLDRAGPPSSPAVHRDVVLQRAVPAVPLKDDERAGHELAFVRQLQRFDDRVTPTPPATVAAIAVVVAVVAVVVVGCVGLHIERQRWAGQTRCANKSAEQRVGWTPGWRTGVSVCVFDEEAVNSVDSGAWRPRVSQTKRRKKWGRGRVSLSPSRSVRVHVMTVSAAVYNCN